MASAGKMPSGFNQSARAVSAEMSSVAGNPQNSADSPRASLPSERRSCGLGDVIAGNYEGRMLNDETNLRGSKSKPNFQCGIQICQIGFTQLAELFPYEIAGH